MWPHKPRFILSLTLALLCSRVYCDEPAATTPAEPFAFADFSWMPGNYGPPESALATKYFVPEIRFDGAYNYEFAHPSDHSIGGSSEVFRAQEFQVTQIGVGGDFNYNDVGFRLMTQFGMYSQTTPNNDPSQSRGQWNLGDAYRYISEAYGTYHLNYMNGVNIQAGIFMSYLGLWSYYNFDNWTYQPSYVSSNTPWFFNGVRVQMYPTDRFKIEFWLINGWESYGMFNEQPGLGVQTAYRPVGWLSFVGNQYYGADTLDTPGRERIHSDDSIMIKYHDSPSSTISKAAFSVTADAGCEQGGGVDCSGQYFLGFMAYNRLWFDHDHYGFTFGGGAIRNPGRYLVLMPPINGATAGSGASGYQSSTCTTPGCATYNYFSENPGDDFKAWDIQVSGDYNPTRNLTFRLEYTHRQSNVPYFTGPDGITPPGGNTGGPGSYVANWSPDLVKAEDRITAAMLIRL